MKDFAAIDFETANGQRSSICSVGLVVVRDGEITIRHYRLVRPYPNFYNYWNTQVHGMSFPGFIPCICAASHTAAPTSA